MRRGGRGKARDGCVSRKLKVPLLSLFHTDFLNTAAFFFTSLRFVFSVSIGVYVTKVIQCLLSICLVYVLFSVYLRNLRVCDFCSLLMWL